MTMTLSPQSTWGVNAGLCLPRSRSATIEANRPTMRPSASITTHFLSASAGLAEKVFMVASNSGLRSQGGGGVSSHAAADGQCLCATFLKHFQPVEVEVLCYLHRLRRDRIRG